MPDVFKRIEWATHRVFGDEPVCVHVGNVGECDIKHHPTYPKFREAALVAGIKSAATSRLWESIIAMGRLCDLDGDSTWRMGVLDCIAPCFRPVSVRIARDFRVELEEIQSAMVVTALEVWNDTAKGVPPRHVRDRMVKAANEVAYRRGRIGSSEYSTDDVNIFFRPENSVGESGLRASSIIDVNNIRDPDVLEQITGERDGALFQRLGHFDVLHQYHEELRAGRRSGSISQSVKSGLSRAWFSNPNLYYYASDRYPPFIGLREAAEVMDISEAAAHRMIRAGQFPFPAARAGRGYRISVKALMHFMDIPDAIIHADDVENGALHAGGGVQRSTP
ncbi:helix-turn-helix domain-containing protein [Streptomyces sp. NPDC002506]|uniref:helix-turn-helix domain-containing protein n=1 Tax=Streptomyces sp. NPDC002506 TaxID=3154536 RepID=UPI0033220318